MPNTVTSLSYDRWVFGKRFSSLQGFGVYKFAVVSLFTNNCVIINNNCSKSIFLRRETWKVFTKNKNLINIVMCWCLAFVGSAPLFFTFESGRFQFPSREAMCLITFEDDTAFIIFSNVFYIATPFAIITVYCVKVFRTVLRSNRVFSHKNNPRRHRPNVEEAKVT